jgi:hypothetical protein
MGRRIVLCALSLLIIAAGSWLTPAHAWAHGVCDEQDDQFRL